MNDKVYLVYRIRDCDDPYYPSYEDVLRIYKSKENAIYSCIDLYKNGNKNLIYNDLFYVKECIYDDSYIHNYKLSLSDLIEIKNKNEIELKDDMVEHNKHGIIFIIGIDKKDNINK